MAETMTIPTLYGLSVRRVDVGELPDGRTVERHIGEAGPLFSAYRNASGEVEAVDASEIGNCEDTARDWLAWRFDCARTVMFGGFSECWRFEAGRFEKIDPAA